jgi:hypothetical protein
MVIMSREDSVNLLILPLVVRSRRIRRGTRGKRKIERFVNRRGTGWNWLTGDNQEKFLPKRAI